MKKLISLILCSSLLLSGCASLQPVGVIYSGGDFYNGATVVSANERITHSKTGKSCAMSVLSLVAVGDNSVESAKKDGMITRVSSIDYRVDNVLGVYGTYCTIVKGE